MAKTNYNQAKRQKENARKARQQEKLAKKLARVDRRSGGAEAPASGEILVVPPDQGSAVRFTSANSRNQLRERQRRDRATAQVMRATVPAVRFVEAGVRFQRTGSGRVRARAAAAGHASAVPGVFRVSVPVCRL